MPNFFLIPIQVLNILFSFGFYKAPPIDPPGVVVKPKEINDVLNNPGIGFVTYQRFNGDTLDSGRDWTEGDGLPIKYQEFKGSIQNKNFPQTTLAYWRVYWKFVEPEKGKYRWDLIDQALDSARRRRQKLMIRVAPHGTGTDNDVPDWYRKIVGNKFNFNNQINNKWGVDPENPNYIKYFGGFINEMGKRYDGNPNLESVDLSIVGAWGEGEASELLSDKTRNALINAYTSIFKKTRLIALLTDKKTNKYIVSKSKKIGWRADCLGDLGIWATEQNGWTHMYDWYPEAIIECGVSNVWKTAPVDFEICRTFWDWKNIQKYTDTQVQYIFDQALKWHISTFNAKSSPVPDEWKHLVDQWLKKMGYRFVLRRFSYPREIEKNKKLSFESWWENKGVAPCYENYPLAIRLKNNQHVSTRLTKADIRTWLPGDNLYNDQVFIPSDIPVGEYELEIGIVDKKTQPVIKLAMEGITTDGWYSLGKIRVK